MLSKFVQKLEQDPKCKNTILHKIQLNYHTVNQLDQLSSKFINITELYLNHNALNSLKGIEQFRCLQSLHVKYNYINDFDDLHKISNKQSLLVLNVAGNPLEKDKRCNAEFL